MRLAVGRWTLEYRVFASLQKLRISKSHTNPSVFKMPDEKQRGFGISLYFLSLLVAV